MHFSETANMEAIGINMRTSLLCDNKHCDAKEHIMEMS